MPKLMVPNPFFCLKIARHKATVHIHTVRIHRCKTGSPDPADFATTRPLILRRVATIRAMFGRPMA
jgi:hypothetical protein